jgi:3-deoxy-D-manno-octulosonic-acid transferase
MFTIIESSMRFLYNVGIYLFHIVLILAGPFRSKAREMTRGRKGWKKRLTKCTADWKDSIWIHCSSLGEFEQGRNLIESIRAQHPNQKMLLTFFSPSGYNIRKNYPIVDHVLYLPIDTPSNAKFFIEKIRPKLAVFVKYDLWLNHLNACNEASVPVVLVSALMKPNSRFLKSPISGLYRSALRNMRMIFTQNHETAVLLRDFCNAENIIQAGDTRFDRANQLPTAFQPIPEIEAFIRGRTCIVAGSPWPQDEKLLIPLIESMRTHDLCWIVAPHEIHPEAIERHCSSSQGKMIPFSKIKQQTGSEDVLWIDNIGMLSRLYHYADLAYIGGGFGAGIHNTQEAAAYGCPVIFGPAYGRFQEAVDLVAIGGAKSVKNYQELQDAVSGFLNGKSSPTEIRTQILAYMHRQGGATNTIMDHLQQKRLI